MKPAQRRTHRNAIRVAAAAFLFLLAQVGWVGGPPGAPKKQMDAHGQRAADTLFVQIGTSQYF